MFYRNQSYIGNLLPVFESSESIEASEEQILSVVFPAIHTSRHSCYQHYISQKLCKQGTVLVKPSNSVDFDYLLWTLYSQNIDMLVLLCRKYM